MVRESKAVNSPGQTRKLDLGQWGAIIDLLGLADSIDLTFLLGDLLVNFSVSGQEKEGFDIHACRQMRLDRFGRSRDIAGFIAALSGKTRVLVRPTAPPFLR